MLWMISLSILRILPIVFLMLFLHVDSLEEKNGKIQGEYWILEDEMSIPESVSIHLLPVDKGISICMMHYKSNSSKWYNCGSL